MNDNIFNDKEKLLKIWLELRRGMDFFASLMWENVKFFSTLISALITADIFFLRFVFGEISAPFNANIPALIFPSLIMYISILGEKELKRRWRRVLENVAYSAKIERLIGLDEEIPEDKRFFKKDKYLFQRWMDNRQKYTDKSSKDFIEGELKGYNMYSHMRKIYCATFLLGLILFILHLLPLLPISLFSSN